MRTPLAGLFCIAAATTVAEASAQDMLGVTYTGTIYAFDSMTGEATLAAPGLFGHNCMARDDSGTLWTIGRTLLGTPQWFLTKIDPSSLEVEIVAPNTDVRAMANAGNGELFTIEFLPGNDQLFRVDTTTGTRTFVGATGQPIQAMTMFAGTLYAWSTGTGLGTLDPNSGAFTDLPGPNGNLQWLAVRSDDQLIGGDLDLYEIDPTTGALTNYATSSVYLRGAETTGLALPFGSGCGGVELRASGALRAGSQLTTLSTGYPPTGALVGIAGAVIVGSSNTTFQNVALPLDLDPLLGTSGCSLYASIDASAIGFTTGTGAPSFFFPIALPPGIAYQTFFLQHLGFDFTGATYWSNGLRLHVGS